MNDEILPMSQESYAVISALHFRATTLNKVSPGTLVVSGYGDTRKLGVALAKSEGVTGAQSLIVNFQKSAVWVEPHSTEFSVAVLSIPFEFRISSDIEMFTSSYESDTPIGSIVGTELACGLIAKGAWAGKQFVGLDDYQLSNFVENKFWFCRHWELVAHPREVFEKVIFEFRAS